MLRFLRAFRTSGSGMEYFLSQSLLERAFVILSVWVKTCPCRKSNPGILMVKPAEDWLCADTSDRLDGPCDRRVLA